MNGDIPKFSLLRFKTVLRDARGPSSPINEVLHTQDELDDYLASCQDRPELKQPVAFPEEKAVAVALGSRPLGGYNAEIIAVVQETGGFVGVQHHVLYVEHVPQEVGTDVITFPQHVIRLRGLSNIVSFRQVPDSIGHSLAALTAAAVAPGAGAASLAGGNGHVTTLAVGEEGTPPTTLAVGEEGAPTTKAVGEEGMPATTKAVGEEAQFTSLFVGEEHPPTAHLGEHPTTLAVGEEQFLTSLFVGEEGHVTSFVVGEEHPPTAHIGEHPTTLAIGEEAPGPDVGRGPFG